MVANQPVESLNGRNVEPVKNEAGSGKQQGKHYAKANPL